MASYFRLREFPVYKETLKFRRALKDLTRKKFPQEERFVLRDQLWRALDSIILNIAEGTDRYSDIEFSRFLNNSLTSLSEIVACLDCALDDSYITDEEHIYFLKWAGNLRSQLLKFSSKVRQSKKS